MTVDDLGTLPPMAVVTCSEKSERHVLDHDHGICTNPVRAMDTEDADA